MMVLKLTRQEWFIRYSLGHAEFYHKFIKDFSKIVKLLSNFLAKDVLFHFYEERLEAFTKIKEVLTIALILLPPI